MMKRIFILASVILFAHASSAETLIEVFTKTPSEVYPKTLPNAKVVIYNPDAPDAVKATAPVFPYYQDNPQRSVDEAKAWWASADGKAFQAQLLESYSGLQIMSNYRIEKTPAIVFDKKYVVYGTHDLAKALIIHDGQEREGNQ